MSMSSALRSVCVVILFLSMAGFAKAQPRNGYDISPGDFVGVWQNVRTQETQVTKVTISRYQRTRYLVTVEGLYRGEPFLFGEYRGKFFNSRYPREREQDDAAILVRVRNERVTGDILIRFNGRREIVTHALLDFVGTRDGYRENLYNVERFQQTGGDDYRVSEGDDYQAAPRRRYGPRYGSRY